MLFVLQNFKKVARNLIRHELVQLIEDKDSVSTIQYVVIYKY